MWVGVLCLLVWFACLALIGEFVVDPVDCGCILITCLVLLCCLLVWFDVRGLVLSSCSWFCVVYCVVRLACVLI